MMYFWTFLLSFVQTPLLTWRAFLHLVGLKRSRLHKLTNRPGAKYRAIVLGLDRSKWEHFDAAYPEVQNIFAQEDTLTSELRLMLMHRDTAVYAFSKQLRTRVIRARERLGTAIYEGTFGPAPSALYDSELIRSLLPKKSSTGRAPADVLPKLHSAGLEDPRPFGNTDDASVFVWLKLTAPAWGPTVRNRVDTTQFLQSVVSVIAESTVSLPLITQDGSVPRAEDFSPLTLTEARERATETPEHAALIYLTLIYKALAKDTPSALGPTLRQVTSLSLAYDFLKSIEACGTRPTFDTSGRFAIQLFLRCLKAEETEVDQQLLSGWQFPALPLLRSINHVPVQDAGYTQAQLANRWIISGKVPSSELSSSNPAIAPEVICIGPTPFATLPLAMIERSSPSGHVASIQDAKALRMLPYSESEEAFSKHTARIASAFAAGIASLYESGESKIWLNAIELPIDDFIFGKAADFWSLLQYLRRNPRTGDTILVGNAELGLAFTAGLRAIGYPELVRIAAPDFVFNPEADNNAFAQQLVDHAFPESSPAVQATAQRNILKSLGSDSARQDFPASKGGALLIGRSLDRNYVTDLVELGREFRKHGDVVFMPTTGQTIQGRLTTLLDSMTSDWYDKVMTGPAARLHAFDGTLGRKTTASLLPHLVRFAQKNEMLDLTEIAVILSLHAQLEKFFSAKIFNYIEAGSETEKSLKALSPAYMVVLPGRDFIAQTACLVGREAGIPSFDVQTVFVGPRSRYKPTKADVQFTIETQSQELFTTYFGLPVEKTALTGCAKVGLVQDQARRLDRVQVRQSIQVEEKCLLVFAGSPFLEEDRPILAAIAEGLSKWPEAHLGIRLHPTADDTFMSYCEKLSVANPAISILRALDLPQTLVAADIMITRFSNVGLEAALLGCDVIACNFTNEPHPISLDRMGVAQVANNRGELFSCIEDFRSHGEQWASLQKSRGAYLQRNQQLLHGPASASMHRTIQNHMAARS